MKARVISVPTAYRTVEMKPLTNDRGQVRQELEDDDPPRLLAGGPGRFHVVAGSQGERLRPQHARAPRPRVRPMIRPIVVSLMPFSLPLDWLSTAVMMMMRAAAPG